MKIHTVGRVARRRALRLGRLLLVGSIAAIAVACSGDNNPTSPSIGGLSPATENVAALSEPSGGGSSSLLAASSKTMVCHRNDGIKEFVVTSVAESSLQSHMEHGDVPYSPVSLAGATFSSSSNMAAAGFAFDGILTNVWNAQGHPTQYIEINFGAPQSLWAMSALVDQTPSGPTTHEVTLDGSLAFMWTGTTNDGDLLTHSFGTLRTATRVRVTTSESPSWVAWHEIEFPPCPVA